MVMMLNSSGQKAISPSQKSADPEMLFVVLPPVRDLVRPLTDRTKTRARALLATGFALLALIISGQGMAQTVPKPVSELASLTLLEGDNQSEPPSESVLWSALDIKLAKNVKTYWRTVGDSGLPPVFTWTGSRNLQSVEVLWPAPIRFTDGSGSSIGYKDRVVLPLKVVALDPKRPVELLLSLDYAVCETLCMPAHYTGKLTLTPIAARTSFNRALANNAALIRDAQARVPVEIGLNTEAPLAVLSVKPDKNGLLIETRWASDEPDGDLFLEGPEGWVFGKPVLHTQRHDGKARLLRTYRVSIDEKPGKDSPLQGLNLVATLVAHPLATETRLTLDKSGQAP